MNLTDVFPKSAAPRVHASDDAWAEMRHAYERGSTTGVLAERHGVAARTIRKRAAEEGWARPAGAGRLRPTPDEILADHPLLEVFVNARSAEVEELLMRPEAGVLSRYAFHRAAEAAALGAPSETLAWLRVVDQLRRNGTAVNKDLRHFDPADVLRAAVMAGAAERMEDDADLSEDDN